MSRGVVQNPGGSLRPVTQEHPPLAVFDLDGVLADVRHRLHLLGGRPKQWDKFFAAAADDPVLSAGADLAHELAANHEIVFLTGRPERSRALTQRWLSEHRLPAGRLLMRPDRDHRPARLFKAEALEGLAETRRISVVVDDDPEVIDLLTERGHPVRLADWLPYTEPLAQAQEADGRT